MSFYTSLTGLNASQTELATVANNIANVGTNGFKRSRVSFGDIISNSPMQNPNRVIGSGTAVRSVSMQFQAGAIESSDNALHLAISGQGFFAVKGGGGTQVAFTRNGEFEPTNDRFIVDASGRRLQLFPTTADGSIVSTALGDTIDAALPLTSGQPQATSLVKLSVNLPADSTVIPAKPIYTVFNPYVFDRNDAATFNQSTSTTVYDSLGNPLAATVYYVKTAAATAGVPVHSWTAHVFVGSTELLQGGVAGIPMTFDAAGVMTAPTAPTVFGAVTPASGGDPLVLAFDHGIATKQVVGAFTSAPIVQDGFAAGQLESVAIDGNGMLQASFSNGDIQIMGKVAMATFSSPEGLKQIGDASYVTTPESGLAITGEAGRGGIGSVQSGRLERSNVDLTQELVGLITAQRNYQANAKAIETASTLLSTIINIR